MPYSLRQPFEKLQDIKMVNDFAALPVEIKIKQDFGEALEIFKKQFKAMRTSLDVFGVLQVFNVSVNLPFTLPRHLVDFISDKYTIIYSNLNMSKIPLVLDGKKQVGQFYFVPAVGKICCGISLCTIG